MDSTTRAGLDEAEFLVLLSQARSGRKEARDRLIEANLRLVWSIVNRFQGRGEREDLFQIGCLGLLKAVDRFDPGYGVKFSTYAVPLIIGEIKRHLRDSGSLHVSRGLKDWGQAVKRTQAQLAEELGREPSLGEIAAALEVDRALVVEALEAMQTPLSLQEELYEGDRHPVALEDTLSRADEGWEERLHLTEGLKLLLPRERELLILRFFQQKTQLEVAQWFGLSQAQVSRLERQALHKLRSYLS
ncbi:MAG: SigB/SigF/SigG family RNA polymerase sigma factor [Firmicutes bacterium]|nr:SigB/SigF/SigG family RNA polymerase sigma factor [Bacillota bacterium]MCL5038699.1 SigB/SigF/SigG family RNA polymerase sigma factor [Bacillota bacterium]